MSPKQNWFIKKFLPNWTIIFILPTLLISSYYIFTKTMIDYVVIGYWFLLSIPVAIGISVYQTIMERLRMQKIQRALQLLISGNYSADMFLRMFSSDTPVQITKTLDALILELQEKMVLMAEEAVESAHQQNLIDGQTREEIIEEERQRVARELHDSVSQQLFAASMMLSALSENSENLPAPYQKQLHLVEKTIHESQSEMRALLLHLRPVMLDGKSLKDGIEQLLGELSTKVPIQLTYKIEDVKLSRVIEDHLFRIVQELLSNVLRHAHAKHLEVYLLSSDQQVIFRMIDDGVGFDTQMQKPGSLGLLNIQERVESMGGNVRIISFPNQGTNVEIKIPLMIGGIERD